jgi:hypothetical protein
MRRFAIGRQISIRSRAYEIVQGSMLGDCPDLNGGVQFC